VSLQDKLYGWVESVYWWLESVIDPGTRNSQYRYADILNSSIGVNSRWLDVGCGHSILPEWVRVPNQQSLLNRAKRVVGLDYDWASLRKNRQIGELVSGDLVSLPFRDSEFNCVSANMVVEHMADPVRSLKELRRLLKPNGLFIFHTPNGRFYMTVLASHIPERIKGKLISLLERREEADVFPTHYRMNRLRDIHQLAAQCGFRVVRCESLNTSATSNMFLGPFAVLELLIRRLFRHPRFEEFRSNFIVILQKI